MSPSPRPHALLRIFISALLAIFLGLSVGADPVSSQEPGQQGDDLGAQLIDAAQRGDLERVRGLVDAGADVDAATRYGSTPLFFAANRGDLDIVRVLLAAGAKTDITDTFYGATPMAFAVGGLSSETRADAYRGIVLALIEAGSAGAGQALGAAARLGDEGLATAALGSDVTIETSELEAAVAVAEEAGHRALAARIAERLPEASDEPTYTVDPARLPVYVGSYRNDDIGTVRISLEDEVLRFHPPGSDAQELRATAQDTFATSGVPSFELRFAGRGGLIESLVATVGSNSLTFTPVDADDDAAAVAETPKAAPLPERTRVAARPWPSFRGPGASGVADGQGAPTTWDGVAGENVLWKTEIPGIGLSSPVIWGDRVFLTTAVSSAGDDTFRVGLYGDVDPVEDESEHTWKVYALDRRTGEILWERTAATGVPKVKRHTKSSHANPTPATDGRHVVFHLGSEGLFTYTVDGELLWKKDLGILTSGWFYDPTFEWGFSSSPILHEGRVIVQTDIQKGSFIAAYDVATGEELWRTERDEIPTWGTPSILPRDEGAEVVTNGTTIRGYDAATGRELWTLGPNSEVTVGTPVIADGVAYVTGGYPPVRPIYAVRPGGLGDLSLPEGETESEHIAWSDDRGGTYIPTPLVYEGQLYMLHNNGRLSAHDAATGETIYRERVGRAESFSGSPIVADGRLYFTTEEGRTYVVRSGPVFEVLAENDLGEIVMTTPAVSDGILVLRGMRHVWGLGEPTDGGADRP